VIIEVPVNRGGFTVVNEPNPEMTQVKVEVGKRLRLDLGRWFVVRSGLVVFKVLVYLRHNRVRKGRQDIVRFDVCVNVPAFAVKIVNAKKNLLDYAFRNCDGECLIWLRRSKSRHIRA